MLGPVRTDHLAFVTGDTGKTVDFYTRVLGWPLVGVHQGTEPDGRRFFMTAFRGDGFCIEFEEVEGRPAPRPTAMGFPHLGIDVGSFEAYDRWKDRLVELGVDHLEMVRGDLFITDPNGVSFQLFVKTADDADPDERAAAARRAVDEWVASRAAAPRPAGR